MKTGYDFLSDLVGAGPPAAGIHSRTVYADDRLKAVVFGFAAGEELSEHTVAVPAIVHVLQRKATLTQGADVRPALTGTWVHIPAKLPHSVRAETPEVMLLLLVKGG